MLSITLMTIILLITPRIAVKKSKFRNLESKITAVENTIVSELTLLKKELSDVRLELEAGKNATEYRHGAPTAARYCSCYTNETRHMRELLLQQDRRHRFIIDQVDSLKEENEKMKLKLDKRKATENQDASNVGNFGLQYEDRIKHIEKYAKKNKKRNKRLQKATENHLMGIRKDFRNEKHARWNNSRDVTLISETLVRISSDIGRLKDMDKLVVLKITKLTEKINSFKKVIKRRNNG